MPAIVAVNSECVTGTVLSYTVSFSGGQSASRNEQGEGEVDCEIP